jgi:NADPH:quinone reductase-like Zn-dependent oxidoreductase
VPRALGDLFKSAIDGNLKVEISKYPLADVSKVHTLIEQRKTIGKLVLIP